MTVTPIKWKCNTCGEEFLISPPKHDCAVNVGCSVKTSNKAWEWNYIGKVISKTKDLVNGDYITIRGISYRFKTSK